ncbi:MAG: hypothetical protein JW828_14120 [Sedimentisphaerales bacterium]|nr:hypothetical protein [Sedimentisphaerales bacterium]
MRTIPTLICLGILFVAAGCQLGSKTGDKDVLVLEFREDQPIRYKAVSQRDILIELLDGEGKPQQNQSHKMSEQLDLELTFLAKEVNLFGLTTVQATVDSAKVTRQAFRTRGPEPEDITEKLKGMTFTFKVSPAGKPTDTSEMDARINEFIESGFVNRSGPVKRIKDPDMVVDFIMLTHHLWDPVAAIKKPSGVTTGATWKSDQLVPLPFPLPMMRETTYTLAEVSQENGRKAVIHSAFGLTKNEPAYWPKAYQEVFNLRGSLFAVLRNYRFESIEGTGNAVFDIQQGMLENESQQWKMKINADFMLPLGNTRPVITIDQKIHVERAAP